MSWRLARSLAVLRAEVDAIWPQRDRSSDGSIGDPAHSSRASDHNPDAAGVVRAIDIDDNDPRPEIEGIGRVIAERLRTTRDARVKYVIYHGQMFSSYPVKLSPAWTWRKYTGPNQHMQHVHISVVADARADDTSTWSIAAPTLRPPTLAPIELEDDMPLIRFIKPKDSPHVYKSVDMATLQWIDSPDALLNATWAAQATPGVRTLTAAEINSMGGGIFSQSHGVYVELIGDLNAFGVVIGKDPLNQGR